MQLPNDPVMLLSVVNTQLRDQYESLGELAAVCQTSAQAISDKLAQIGYHYDQELNQFR